MTECTEGPRAFTGLGARRVEAGFSAGCLTADAGPLLLREADRRLGPPDPPDAAIPEGLAGTPMGRAQVGTIRLRLLKVAGLVAVSVRRLYARMAGGFPPLGLSAVVLRRLGGAAAPALSPGGWGAAERHVAPPAGGGKGAVRPERPLAGSPTRTPPLRRLLPPANGYP